MKTTILTLTALAAFIAMPYADAASIQNADAEAHAVTITEKGVRSEQTIAASGTITACAAGCFIVFPNGEMLPLAGPEAVVIEKGAGRVVSK